MGNRHLRRFQAAGAALARLALVEGSEGNLSMMDGERLLITRTGSELASLSDADVLEGTLAEPPLGASSDLERHRWVYEEGKGSAVVHAHPPGTMPHGWQEGQPHGIYAHGRTLEHALAAAVSVSTNGGPPPSDGPQTSATFQALWFDDHRLRDAPHGAVSMLDQTRLPHETVVLSCGSPEEVAASIRRMAVRGAPVLGIAAAYGLVLGARLSGASRRDALIEDLEACGTLLIGTRPTAVNIRWAVARILRRARLAEDAEGARVAVLDEARAIEREDARACSAMGWLGAELIPQGANVLTHCNTGMLCTAGIGTALGVIWCAHLEGKGIHVWVDETRPALQGARLTTWELDRLGVPMTLVADSAAGALMARGKVDLVIVGADRIAANGDVANKVGTHSLAVLAGYHGIPFYVAVPISTIDLDTASGADIPIEERDPSEVTEPLGVAFAPAGVRATNPAFDVTSGELVTAIVTERGIVHPPYGDGLRAITEGER